MRGAERGFLLLTGNLGNPERRPLTMAQLRSLASRVQLMQKPIDNRDLTARDLKKLGYSEDMARRILALLEDRELLEVYLSRGRRENCIPLTRVTEGYPAVLRQKLGMESPGCLWCKGDISLLDTPKVSLVGSRDLNPANREFARQVGIQAARQGYTLVSGNARGADQTAQRACLEFGGRVISVVADELTRHREQERLLYISEDCFDGAFSAPRALSRNRVIHCLSEITFVAQCGDEIGGTWNGTVKNLRQGWSRVYCFNDASNAAAQLLMRGAEKIDTQNLSDFTGLEENTLNFFDQ